MYISFEQGRRARAVLAWVLACMVGGLLLTAPLAVPMIIGDGTAPDGDNMLAVAAGIAGFAYWHFAGRPRPPY